MPLIESRFRIPFLVLFAVFTLYGTSFTIIGATLPMILSAFHWSYLAAGFVLGASAITYFLSTFVAGHLVQRYGPKPTILLGLILDIVGLAFFAASSDPVSNTLLGGLIGLGQGCVEIGINWSTLRIDTHHTGRPMNLMHGAFAVGAILGPLATGLFMQSGFAWTTVYRGMAWLFALLAILIVITALPTDHNPQKTQHQTRTTLTNQPAYWLSFFALFLYVGVELGVSNWVAEYFVTVFNWSVADSAWLVSLFWAGLLTGRFGVPLFYKGVRHNTVLIILSGLASCAIILLVLLGYTTTNPLIHRTSITLVFLAGLGCSIYYPAVITLLGSCFPQAQSQAIGFAATGGGIGAFVFPFLMSALAQHWGIRTGFATYALFSIAMTLAVVWLVFAASRHSKPVTV